MSDSIERQDAIDAHCEICGDRGRCNSDICPDMEVFQLLPSAQPEQRWIPCSEGLPEVHETGNSFSGVFMQSYPVLVYGVPEGEEECGFHVVTYCDDLNGYTYWSTELDAVTIDGVRAWMPLPEPYAERREE